jgi:cobalamin biosynthetic protein CobC
MTAQSLDIGLIGAQSASLPHGGRLRAAAERYRIPISDWLDLSTGINPQGWPVPAGVGDWSRLPEDEDDLIGAALDYYCPDAGHDAASLLPVAGSQAAIGALPRLRAPCRVGVIAPGYAEHGWAWKRAGHEVLPLAVNAIDAAAPGLDVLVLIHPNNPTGSRFSRPQLERWHRILAARDGWLVVDEAFIDATPALSLADRGPRTGLILLRSIGKFFGLAGARVGFVLAWPALTSALAGWLGPWSIANPSRQVAAAALADRDWQADARSQLIAASERLADLMRSLGLPPAGGTALFQWTPTPRAGELYRRMARTGILTRLFDNPPALRLGLPGPETAWKRLEQALRGLDLGR